MTVIRRRPRILAVCGVLLYLFAGFAVSDVESVEVGGAPPACPAPLLRAPASRKGTRGFSVLQGNAWMLPSRPLLLPYAFSTERRERLEGLVRVVRGCRPDIVVLQEIFETGMVSILERSLPGYTVVTSGESEFSGTVNASGLVTLTRLPVTGSRFHPFPPLPERAKTIERLGRKGYLVVDVDAPGFSGSVVNLHLYAARDPEETSITRAQLGEVVAFAQSAEAEGHPVLVAGDFNLDRPEMEALVPASWSLSRHGPTYDPPGNRFTVEGANNTPDNHEDRRLGRGVRTVDFLVNPQPARIHIRSSTLPDLQISDHYYLEHQVMVDDGS